MLPKKLHDDRVIELNQMCFMYEKDKYKLSKLEGFKPFFCDALIFAEEFVSKGGGGDSSRVPQYERKILNAISEEEMFNAFDFIF
jgi:hypothetical protein